MTVVGTKYTTARAVGARAAVLAAKALGASTRSTDTAATTLPGAGIADHEALTIETARAVGLEVAPPIIRHITAIYGDRCAAIVRLMAERSDWRMPLIPGRPIIGAEVIHAIRAEMACTLADIVIRRTELGAMGHPGADVVGACARIAAEELGWDNDRRDREIAAVDAFYLSELEVGGLEVASLRHGEALEHPRGAGGEAESRIARRQAEEDAGVDADGAAREASAQSHRRAAFGARRAACRRASRRGR